MTVDASKMRNGEMGSRLPPHDMAAEQGVLGCCVMEAALIFKCLEWFAVEEGKPVREVFYDLRHQRIFEAMRVLYEAGKGMDTIILCSELQDRGELEAVGGLAYISALPDAVPTALNIEAYLEIVWEKYVGRQGLQVTTRIQQAIYDRNGITEGGIARVERELEGWQELALRSNARVQPQDLKRPGEFGEAVFHHWFKEGEDDKMPGLDLPIGFPLRLREAETTLLCGEDGSGKSTFAGQIAVALMKQGWKGFIASMEVKPSITLWMMQRQILGEGPRLPATDENRRRVANALAFLDARLWMYDFLGITDWRLLLDVMRFARTQQGVNFFIVDSIMRIGIASDDLAMQDRAASEFGAFAVQTGAHLIFVHHLNKGRDGDMKTKATGSKRWTDNTHNLLEMKLNKKKAVAVADAKALKEAGKLGESEFNTKMQELAAESDTILDLGKQRYPGARQNARKHLWFDERSLQFRDKANGVVMDYLM